MTMKSANSPSRRKAKVQPSLLLRSCFRLPKRLANICVSKLTEYAQVLKMLGNGRLEALCFDGEKRLAHIRGKLRKKVWINQGDIILLSLRDYQDEKGDVILKYSADEARSLKAYGELPESAKINETDTYVHLFTSALIVNLLHPFGASLPDYTFSKVFLLGWHQKLNPTSPYPIL